MDGGSGPGPMIYNNIIRHNYATEGGGGIAYGHGGIGIIVNNTIYGNRSQTGGGLYDYGGPGTIASNCIFLSNTADSYNEIRGTSIVTYSDIQGGWPGEGNISVAPLFRDSLNGDLHLISVDCGNLGESPCIDAGRPDILDSLLDCDWGLGTSRSDMGAYGGGDYSQVGVEDRMPQIPDQFILSQNYPNPFNSQTLISYELPQEADVTIEIFDILGRSVARLVDAQQDAGFHSIIWDAKNAVSGMYLYKLQAGEFSEIKKCVLMR